MISKVLTLEANVNECRKIQLNVKERVPSAEEADKTKDLNLYGLIDSIMNAFNKARMVLTIKAYSQFNEDKHKQSDIKLDSYKFKIKR